MQVGSSIISKLTLYICSIEIYSLHVTDQNSYIPRYPRANMGKISSMTKVPSFKKLMLATLRRKGADRVARADNNYYTSITDLLHVDILLQILEFVCTDVSAKNGKLTFVATCRIAKSNSQNRSCVKGAVYYSTAIHLPFSSICLQSLQ